MYRLCQIDSLTGRSPYEGRITLIASSLPIRLLLGLFIYTTHLVMSQPLKVIDSEILQQAGSLATLIYASSAIGCSMPRQLSFITASVTLYNSSNLYSENY